MRFRTLVALSTMAALGATPPQEAWSTSPTVGSTSPTAILGSFFEGARILASSLRPQTVSISTGPGPGAGSAILNLVRIGPFGDHAQAEAKLRELDGRGYPGFVALTKD